MAVGGNFTSCNCGPDTAACESPTQPVATVGLCLADGSPIAVTVVRDCAGTVTSEGWVDLTTGAWSAGAPPAGTIACGDSRSITTNGTFCDVDDDGAVLGLVLVEYQYAADGSIAAVRLVDAVTGETYTPAGTITTCPAGVAQPERDLLQLCDTATDGAVTVFLRDYARNETGQITGHSDYALDGTPYTPAGAVGACPDCPTSYATECWSFVQAQVSYDNTTGGNCGAIEPRSMGQCAGTWVISSWVIDGVERVSSPVTFQATGCGGNANQFHGAWAATLSTIDPTSTWEAAYNGTCLFYIRTTGVDPDTEYGQMTMYLATAPDTVYTLSPAASRSETQYTKVYRQECDGSTSVTWLDADGNELAEQPEGDLTPCGGTAPVQECASAVTVLRLCDLNPDAPPDDQGKRCAIPFLRHLVYDCTGALVESRDTTPDGTTPYTPVEAVDCGSGGVPAMVEVPWEVTDIQPDPASPAGRGFVFTLSPIDDPDTVGTVTVTTTSTANTACPATPPEYQFRNPCTYTFTPDQALQDAATYVRCDLLDFDTFEPVTGLTPAPSRLGGTAYWDGTTVRATAENGVGEMYYDGPPPTWSYRVGNTGGGNSCSNLSFAAVSLRPEGCCAPCGESGGGDGTERTVQEVCVIATATPDDVMTWTRVIEDGGATIYYLDQDGARYDTTLPAGHQIVACPSAPDECQHCETLTLCDVQPDESPGEPEIAYEAIPLADLGPAGSYGDGSPVTGTLPNGVGYSVNVGEWGPGQGHYTFYPYDGTQTWTFTEPVYLRFGLRGLNISPTECYVLPEGAVPESINPNHTWDPDGRYLCEITGQSSATDESVFLLGPVTELPIVPSGSNTGGRGPGLIEVGFPVEAPAPGSSTSFLRVVCRDCSGAVTSVTDTTLDGEPYTPSGEVTTCGGSGGGGEQPAEPCRDTSSTLLCDTSAADLITVFDPANRPDDDGWEVVSFTGERPGAGPEAPLPYPARYGTPYGYPALGARADQYGGYGGGSWQGYDTAPVRWVLRKTFTAPEDGVAIAQSVGFRGDGGARVRINGIDAGMYGQWNQPATSGTAEIPVTAGANVVEIEVRDVNGVNNVVGRLDIALPRTVQFMRRQTVDCETGDVISTTDTTLDGEPYEVTGEVGQCQTVSECCEQPPPELRVDVESDVMCIRDAAGEITGQVVVERVYDDQSGDRTEQRLTDPTTGDPVELPDGAELVLCQDPPCPTAFATECVGAVTRTEAGYDNTSTINGVPGKCGSVQGPGGQFPCQPTTGALTITSWVVDGEEVIGEGGGRSFNGGPCGEGTAGNLGMHHNWALALTNLDPSGADWSAQEAEGCAWFVGSSGGTNTVYGAMTVVDAEGRQWILGPAQACEEVQFTKVYSQECDGSVSVSWLDAQGVPTDAPEGDLVPCGTGCGTGSGAGLDVEVLELCDVAEDGTSVPFLRHITYGTGGQVSVVLDTGLDAFSPYTPSGTVGVCQPREDGQEVELLAMCVIDNATGASIQRILAEVRYDTETGERTGVSYVDPVTWGPVAFPGGTHIGLCPEAEPEPAPDVELLALCDVAEDGTSTPFLRHLVYSAAATAPAVLDTLLDGATPYTPAGEVGTCAPEEECPSRNTLSACRCDDTDGDGVADTGYVELLAVDCEGVLTSVGTYTEDLSAPYTPVAPVDCETADPGPEPVVSVQAHRVQLAPGQSWDASTVASLRSVTLTAHTGDGLITTGDGVSTLFQGESVSWSINKETDAELTGPLTVDAVDGVITVTWTRTS